MKKILAALFIALTPIAMSMTLLGTATTVAQADEPRFDFSSRKKADVSYARVFAQFSPAGSRAFDRAVKKLVIVQFSKDGTVSGGRAEIKRKKPTPAQYYAAMAKALDGKSAAEVVAVADRLME